MPKKQLSKSEFSTQADAVARRIVQALTGEQDAFLVLEALCRVHRFTCMQLPHEALGAAGFALGAYAGELMQASAAKKSLVSSTHIH